MHMAKQELLIYGVKHQTDGFPIAKKQLDAIDLNGKRIGVELPDDFIRKYKLPMQRDALEGSLRRSILIYAGHKPEKVGAMDIDALRSAFRDEDMKAAYGARKFWYDMLQYLYRKGAKVVALEDPKLLKQIRDCKIMILKAENRKDDIEVSATRLEEEYITNFTRVDAMATKIKPEGLDMMLVGNIHLDYLGKQAMQLPNVRATKRDLCPPKSTEEAEKLEKYAKYVEGVRQFYLKMRLRKRKVARVRARLGPNLLKRGNVFLFRNEKARRRPKPKA